MTTIITCPVCKNYAEHEYEGRNLICQWCKGHAVKDEVSDNDSISKITALEKDLEISASCYESLQLEHERLAHRLFLAEAIVRIVEYGPGCCLGDQANLIDYGQYKKAVDAWKKFIKSGE